MFFAEAIDPQGDLSDHRDKRLHAMREWHKWANSPYDEQLGLSDLPQDRRGRKYRFSSNNADEFPTPHPNYWPNWSKPSYLQYYMSNHSRTIAPKAMPRRAEPVVTSGAQGTPPPQRAFFDSRFNAGAPSSGSQQRQTGPTAWTYTPKTDPWSDYGNDFAEGNESTMTTEPGIDNASLPEQTIVIDHVVPPMAYDPSSESADEDEASPEDEWVYPDVPEPLHYERYIKAALNVADRIGTVKLLAQHAFILKPMIEEAIVPSKSTMSTYSSYLRKVTSYVASWTGCVTMKVLRSCRKRSDAEWIRLYNYCMQKTNLSQTHMYLGAKELAALCGVLEADEQVVRDALRPITNRRFLNQAATSSADCSRTAGTIRITKTGLFTDFDIQRKSLARNLTNIQGR